MIIIIKKYSDPHLQIKTAKCVYKLFKKWAIGLLKKQLEYVC